MRLPGPDFYAITGFTLDHYMLWGEDQHKEAIMEIAYTSWSDILIRYGISLGRDGSTYYYEGQGYQVPPGDILKRLMASVAEDLAPVAPEPQEAYKARLRF